MVRNDLTKLQVIIESIFEDSHIDIEIDIVIHLGDCVEDIKLIESN